MTIKIMHTADLHLGMKFRGYDPEVQNRLIQARFNTFKALVETANRENCDLLVIAGDLFNDRYVAKKNILTAAHHLHRFTGRLVLILPGNHDYLLEGEDDLWGRFQKECGDQVVLLRDPRPYHLEDYGLNLVIYPGPCTAKHSQENAIGWVADCLKEPEGSLHIGVAHGSLEGLSPDFQGDYYPMTEAELKGTGVDLWLLGHTHVRFPDEDQGQAARIFFPGTPEPDGFGCRHPGYAWLLEVGEDKTVGYQSFITGCHQFILKEFHLATEGDLESLKAHFHQLSSDRHLVKLLLRGRLPGELFDRRNDLLAELRRCVLHLEFDLSELFRMITSEDIDREFTEGSFPHRLLSELAQGGGSPMALQMAYDLIREVRT